MSTHQGELIPMEPRQAPAVVSEAASLMEVISRAASDPQVDVGKLERMMDLYERIQANKAKVEFSAAMARVQKSLPQVGRDKLNTQTNSRYTTHERLAKDLKPVYTAEGFSIEFSEGEAPRPEYVRVVGVLRHAAGHEVTRHVDLPLDTVGLKGNANKTLVHATGSTMSYGRRYLTLLLFDVATGDDDDAQAASAGGYIDEKQASILRDWILKAQRAEPAVCKWLKIAVLEDLPAAKYVQALEALKAAAKGQP